MGFKPRSMKLTSYLPAALCCLLLAVSCDSSESKKESVASSEMTDPPPVEEPDWKLEEIPTSGMPDALLDMYTPAGDENFDAGKVSFSFNIRNYPLGKDRPLMFAVNGRTAIAQGSPSFGLQLEKGTYRAVAFLLDERGLALKEYGNFSERYFTVEGAAPFSESLHPAVYLHLPGEEQQFAWGEPVPIDFLYLGGDPVLDRVSIQVEIGTFRYTTQKVAAVAISGLPRGTFDLRVRLLATDSGTTIPGRFTTVSRKIRVE